MAQESGGSVVWNLDVDKGKLTSGLANARSEVDKFADNAEKKFLSMAQSITDSMNRAKAGSQLFAGGLAAIGAGIGFAVKAAGEMEMLRSSLDTLTGSAEKGAKVFTDLNKFAAKTPFETGDLAKATQTMLAFGITSEEVMPNLQMLGDISLGNAEKLSGLSLAFSQVQSTGRLMGQDLLQMINQGFNPLTIISQKTGKSMKVLKDEMAAGSISAEMVADAMKTATGQGGLFFKGMERGAQTLTGVTSTLKDTIGMTIRQMVGLSETGEIVKGGLVDIVKNAFIDLTNFLTDNQGKIISFFSGALNWIKDNGPIVVGIIFGGLLPAVYGLAASFVAIMGPLVPFIAAGAAIGFLLKQLGFDFNTLKTAVQVIIDVFRDWDPGAMMEPETWAKWKGFIGIVLAAKQSLDDFGTAVQIIIDVIKGFDPGAMMDDETWGRWSGFVDIILLLKDVLDKHLMPSFQALWNVIKDELLPAFTEFWQAAGPVLGPILKGLAVILVGVLLLALKIVVDGLRILVIWVTTIINQFTSLMKFFGTIAGAITSAFSGVKDAITKPFTDAWNSVTKVADNIKNALNKISPYYRESPSLIDNVHRGVSEIIDEYRSLKGISLPSLSGLAPTIDTQPAFALTGSEQELTNNQSSSGRGGQTINFEQVNLYDEADIESLVRELGFEATINPGMN